MTWKRGSTAAVLTGLLVVGCAAAHAESTLPEGLSPLAVTGPKPKSVEQPSKEQIDKAIAAASTS